MSMLLETEHSNEILKANLNLNGGEMRFLPIQQVSSVQLGNWNGGIGIRK